VFHIFFLAVPTVCTVRFYLFVSGTSWDSCDQLKHLWRLWNLFFSFSRIHFIIIFEWLSALCLFHISLNSFSSRLLICVSLMLSGVGVTMLMSSSLVPGTQDTIKLFFFPTCSAYRHNLTLTLNFLRTDFNTSGLSLHDICIIDKSFKSLLLRLFAKLPLIFSKWLILIAIFLSKMLLKL
jgi:hypothetical protein